MQEVRSLLDKVKIKEIIKEEYTVKYKDKEQRSKASIKINEITCRKNQIRL